MVEEETTTLLTGVINEEWRSISGFINYQISNIGRIRNVRTGRILKPRQDKDGYLLIDLCENNIRKTSKVHRLVAAELIDNPDNKSYIDHVDHNKQNNCINNIRWVSSSENSMNRSKTKKTCSSYFKGVYWYKDRQEWKAQIQTNSGRKHIGYFDSEIDAARAYNTKARELFGEYANLNDISDIV